MQQIYNAEDLDHAKVAAKAFAIDYGTKFPKAVAKILDELDVLLEFSNYPAVHWVHLRKTNPIESTFATVRHRTKVTKGPASRVAGLAQPSVTGNSSNSQTSQTANLVSRRWTERSRSTGLDHMSPATSSGSAPTSSCAGWACRPPQSLTSWSARRRICAPSRRASAPNSMPRWRPSVRFDTASNDSWTANRTTWNHQRR